MKIAVNPPKTPVTEGSGDKAFATLPNVCKMPGPPAPFVPTPLPNLGRSEDKPDKYTTTVKFHGKKVAIKGATFKSTLSADMASKSTGGGIISAVEEGKTGFTAPGSMNVKAEGKNIQLLGDAMANNGSNPWNSATLPGNIQLPGHIQMIADDLCNDFCAYGNSKNWKNCKSSELESQLANDPKWQGLGITFGGSTTFALGGGVGAAGTVGTAASLGRSAIQSLSVGGVLLEVIKIIPDVVFKQHGMVQQIFDFKFPSDRWRKGQKEIYKEAAGNNEPIEISRATCGC